MPFPTTNPPFLSAAKPLDFLPAADAFTDTMRSPFFFRSPFFRPPEVCLAVPCQTIALLPIVCSKVIVCGKLTRENFLHGRENQRIWFLSPMTPAKTWVPNDAAGCSMSA